MFSLRFVIGLLGLIFIGTFWNAPIAHARCSALFASSRSSPEVAESTLAPAYLEARRSSFLRILAGGASRYTVQWDLERTEAGRADPDQVRTDIALLKQVFESEFMLALGGKVFDYDGFVRRLDLVFLHAGLATTNPKMRDAIVRELQDRYTKLEGNPLREVEEAIKEAKTRGLIRDVEAEAIAPPPGPPVERPRAAEIVPIEELGRRLTKAATEKDHTALAEVLDQLRDHPSSVEAFERIETALSSGFDKEEKSSFTPAERLVIVNRLGAWRRESESRSPIPEDKIDWAIDALFLLTETARYDEEHPVRERALRLIASPVRGRAVSEGDALISILIDRIKWEEAPTLAEKAEENAVISALLAHPRFTPGNSEALRTVNELRDALGKWPKEDKTVPTDQKIELGLAFSHALAESAEAASLARGRVNPETIEALTVLFSSHTESIVVFDALEIIHLALKAGHFPRDESFVRMIREDYLQETRTFWEEVVEAAELNSKISEVDRELGEFADSL